MCAFKISTWDSILLNSSFKLNIKFMWVFLLLLFQVMTALTRHKYFASY